MFVGFLKNQIDGYKLDKIAFKKMKLDSIKHGLFGQVLSSFFDIRWKWNFCGFYFQMSNSVSGTVMIVFKKKR